GRAATVNKFPQVRSVASVRPGGISTQRGVAWQSAWLSVSLAGCVKLDTIVPCVLIREESRRGEPTLRPWWAPGRWRIMRSNQRVLRHFDFGTAHDATTGEC